MNMREPTTVWDRNPTDAELNRFYGKDKSTEVADEYFEVLTKTVRSVPAANLGLPFVSYRNKPQGSIEQYPLTEVLVDYGTDPFPLKGLIEVIEKSDCPLVAAYRQRLAEHFADLNADEVENFKSEE